MIKMKCRICQNDVANMVYMVRDRMYTNGDKYKYFQCAECQCLQIADIPKDIYDKYSSNYYSFSLDQIKRGRNQIFKYFVNIRDSYTVFRKNILGLLLSELFPNDRLGFLAHIKLTVNSSILDIGCGSGAILHELKDLGFTNILGIDPFIEKDINYKNNLKIIKSNISAISGKWDVIIFNHSLEHICDPFAELNKAKALLADKGIIIIRTPLADSYAMNKYSVDWVQIDAPRHFHIFSIKSINILSKKVGMAVLSTVYDSNPFQFWGSEQYIKGIPLFSENSYAVSPKKSIFALNMIRKFKKQAIKLNKNSAGDQASFYLVNSNESL
ncbi:MAG: class I SAM-dependent methyltransferase [Candidatus Edwardsbacteria bacterium]|nr:class I SAM-dependent methyltransferase [Candidatus Edwardsbacteria bacterium]